MINDDLIFINLTMKKDFYPFYNKMKNELIAYYPSFDKWFNSLFDSYDKLNENRLAFTCVSQVINKICFYGVAILKINPTQKICMLWVIPKYRNLGIGSLLIEKSIKHLDNNRDIIITCAKQKSDYFSKLVNKFKFYKCNTVIDKSKYKYKEVVFFKERRNLND